jgi:hypothetical protein
MATLAENDRDAMIINLILEEHKHLGKNRSGAVRVALEHWYAAQPQRPAPPSSPSAPRRRWRLRSGNRRKERGMSKTNEMVTARAHIRRLSDALYVCLHSDGLAHRDYRVFGIVLKGAREWLSITPQEREAGAEESDQGVDIRRGS